MKTNIVRKPRGLKQKEKTRQKKQHNKAFGTTKPRKTK